MNRLSWLLALVVLTGPAHAFDPTGIWKLSFEPGLPGVDEPSEGYMVFLPNGTFFRIGEACCGGVTHTQVGVYLVEGNTIKLGTTRVEPTWYETKLELVGEAEVVPFDDLYGEPVVVPVLKGGRGLNYSYARLYPPAAKRAGPSATHP